MLFATCLLFISCGLLLLRSLGDVFDSYIGRNPAARSETGNDFDLPRLDYLDEIVKDRVCDILVKNPFVTKALQIELEALEFDTFLVRHVAEYESSEVGLARLGAD